MKQIVAANSWREFEQTLGMLGTTEKGRAFEELTRLYLLTNSAFATKIRNVWHHSEVPMNVVDDLGLQQPEIGVDLGRV